MIDSDAKVEKGDDLASFKAQIIQWRHERIKPSPANLAEKQIAKTNDVVVDHVSQQSDLPKRPLSVYFVLQMILRQQSEETNGNYHDATKVTIE